VSGYYYKPVDDVVRTYNQTRKLQTKTIGRQVPGSYRRLKFSRRRILWRHYWRYMAGSTVCEDNALHRKTLWW